MPRFIDLPIRRKLVIAFSLTTVIALLLVTLFFSVSTWMHERRAATRELQATAAIIAANSTAALAFRDAKAATEILNSMKAVPDVLEAVLYDGSNTEFAHYANANGQADGTVSPAPVLWDIAGSQVTVQAPVVLDGENIGRIVLHASLNLRTAKLREQFGAAVLAAAASFLVAVIVAWILQHSITEPLRRLTDLMRRVSRSHDYSVRTSLDQKDEVGVLASGINEMLSRVQERDGELEQHRRELEHEVSRRTSDLKDANLKLTEDLEERERTAADLLRAHHALERHNAQYHLLTDMNDQMQVCHNVEETRPVIAHYAHRLFPASAGGLYLFNNSRSLVAAHVRWGSQPPGEESFRQPDCWALRQGRTHEVHNPADELVCAHCPEGMDTPYVCVPMIAYGDVMGVLHLRLTGGETDIDESLRQLAITAAEHLSLALANLKLREALQEQSVRDPLTRLYNRRFMQESLERELARAVRGGEPVAVVMMDVDHFKRYNDSHGHEAGDMVLEQLARFMQRSIRAGDIACRFGGEEFMIIMPGADANAAMTRAEQLRQGIKRVHIEFRGTHLESVTLSLGVAVAPLHGGTVDDLVNAVDEAMYKAKKEGRDRVVLAHDDNTPAGEPVTSA